MANGEEMFTGLQALPVFGDRPGEDRRRALLQAALALMQPQNPVTGGGPVAAFGNAVQAGLTSLDQSDAQRRAAEQQQFQNLLSTRQVATDERQAEIAQQRADTEQAAAESQARTAGAELTIREQRLEEEIRQFDEQVEDRKAIRMLNEAKARLQDRLPEGQKGSVSAPELDLLEMKSKAATLWAEDEIRFRETGQRRYSSVDDPRLYDAAFSAVAIREGQAGTENLALVAQDPQEAADLGANIQQIADPSVARQPSFGETPDLGQDQATVDRMKTWTPVQWQRVIDLPEDSPERQRVLRLLQTNAEANAAFQAAKRTGDLKLK